MKSYIIGLTGQSGSGKTTVCDTFKLLGFHIINADLVSKYITENSKSCIDELKTAFGEEYIENGVLNRRKLGSLVFADREKLDKLMEITFPYIIEEINRQITKIGNNKLIVVDAPTLFESGLNKSCDEIVSVISDKALRLDRIMKRDKISKEEAEKRFSSQLSEKFFKENSDFIIENSGSEEELIKKAVLTAQSIKEIYNGKKSKEKE